MKILWIGAGVGPKLSEEIQRNGGKLFSAQLSQNNLIQGLDALAVDMDSLNGPNIGTRAIKAVKPEQWSRNGTSRDMSVGYQNIKYLNLQLKQKALCTAAKCWATENKDNEEVVVFVYGMHSPFMAAACQVKKQLPHAKICLIVPDLPQYMDLKMSRLKKLLKAIDWQRIRHIMKKVDKYVLYAEPMAAFLGLKDGQWMVMEGSFDSTQLADTDCKPDPDRISVLYSGVLDLHYGIPELVDAMRFLDDNYELWLLGDGNAAPMIRQRAQEDFRIRFFGYMSDRQKLLNMQAQATMLINPRSQGEVFCKYSFPSKTFEYLASGRPVISSFLPGIPAEYHPYLHQLTDATAEGIASVVTQVASLSQAERDETGKKARAFVVEKKNKFAQAKKIAEFMDIV